MDATNILYVVVFFFFFSGADIWIDRDLLNLLQVKSIPQSNTTNAKKHNDTTLVDFFFFLLLVSIFFIRNLEFDKLPFEEFPA